MENWEKLRLFLLGEKAAVKMNGSSEFLFFVLNYTNIENRCKFEFKK